MGLTRNSKKEESVPKTGRHISAMTNKPILLLFAILSGYTLFVPVAYCASTDVRYVSTTGLDSNDGMYPTQQGAGRGPWATFAHANSLAQPGWTIRVASGTYNQTVSTTANGTSTAPITFISNSLWGAKINGGRATYVWVNSGNYMRIYGFDITGLAAWPLGSCDSGPVAVINRASNTDIAYNHIHDLGSVSTCFSAAIDNANGGSGNNVHGNVINNLSYGASDGHSSYGIYQQTSGRIYNNLIYRGASFGITGWHGANNVYIYNNTVDDMQMNACIQVGTGDAGAVTSPWYDVENNIVSNCGKVGIYVYTNNLISKSSVFRNNLTYNNGYDWLYGGACSGTMQSCGLIISGTVTGNPQYASRSTGNFHLLSTSPAINHANTGNVPTTDIDGNPRPYPTGGAYDIGAYEYTTSVSGLPVAPTDLAATVK